MLDLLFNRKISNRLTQILPLAYALTYCVCTYVLYGLARVQHPGPLPSVPLRGVSISTLHQANHLPHYSTHQWLTGYCVLTGCVRLTESHHGLLGHLGRVIYKCPYTGWQPFWCMSVPNNPVVRHSRQANRIAIRFRTRKLLLLLTARIDWCLGKEVYFRVGAP